MVDSKTYYLSVAQNLLHYYQVNRQVGHTQTMIEIKEYWVQAYNKLLISFIILLGAFITLLVAWFLK